MAAKIHFTRALLVAGLLVGQSCSRTGAQSKFASPEDAAKALEQALKTDNMDGLRAIFGRDALDAAASGDSVSDHNDRQALAVAMGQSWHWDAIRADRKQLIIGDEQWPFPAPLVKTGDEWQFDSEAGKHEVLARRIGRNEIRATKLCSWYADVQKNYSGQSHDGKPAGLFAQRIRSTSGHQDGLYWEAKPDEQPSPLGDLAAEAAQDGYTKDRAEGSPFWGYRFRILTTQGASAPGGKKSYVVNGDMTGGFALVAYPAKYGSSGIMTFVVNQDGKVYEKDLGPDTDKDGAGMTEYNPDDTWAPVSRS